MDTDDIANKNGYHLLSQEEVDSNAQHDDLVMKQQTAIESEISSTIPLVGGKEELSSLMREYTDDTYRERFEDIQKTYGKMRRMRPDGNCFFRGFCYGVLERLQTESPEEKKMLRDKVAASKDILTAAGLTQFTVDDFYETFLDMVDKVVDGMSTEELENHFQDQHVADYLVVFLRLLTSAELKRSADFYSNFIEGDRTLEEFCQFEVEPMYKESDHIHIIALATALSIGIRVVYVDRGMGAEHNFPEGMTPYIHLLYRPGHYDIIYPKEPCPSP